LNPPALRRVALSATRQCLILILGWRELQEPRSPTESSTKEGSKRVAIKLTEKAISELKSIMAKEVESHNLTPKAVLRLMVVGGGCSGFSYKMGFDEDVKPEDRVEEVNGVRVAVDEKSYLYLSGTEVDFQDGLMGRGFVFQNPNASGSCGCGSSFSV